MTHPKARDVSVQGGGHHVVLMGMQAPSTTPPKKPEPKPVTTSELRAATAQLRQWHLTASSDLARREMETAMRRLQRITRHRKA